MLPERHRKLIEAANRRQTDLTVILENVQDPHNIGAVMRSCDAVGIFEIFILNTHPDLQKKAVALGKRTSSGSRKWLSVNYFTDAETCFRTVRSRYDRILGTSLGDQSTDLYEVDFRSSLALLFGNEQYGISQESLAQTDGNFLIPQVGFGQSLNISVACAVTLYEAFRQRRTGPDSLVPDDAVLPGKEAVYRHFLDRQEEQYSPNKARAKDL